MKGFNLSGWALRHRPLIWYLMLVFVAVGVLSYGRLGRDEDPPFTIKAMVVTAKWPGATVDEMLKQVTDRLEKKLQETPSLDYVKSYTKAGESTVFVFLKDTTPPTRVPDIWYQVRKKVDDIKATLPQGTLGPFFDDELSDTYGVIYAFTADGFSFRELRDRVEAIRSALLNVPGVGKISLVGAQDEKIYIEFDTRKLAGLGIVRQQLIDALRAQNAMVPQGAIQTDREKIQLRVSGHFVSEESLRNLNLYANGHFYRLRDIATVRRGYADPPQPMFRFDGVPAIGLAISMAKGGNILTLGADLKRRMAELIGGLPVGIELHLVADQPAVVTHSVDGFVKVLAEAIGIVLLVSFISLGLRAGAIVAITIPLVLCVVFAAMLVFGIALQRVSLGALIISLGLLVDDAMITIEMMVSRLERGFDRIAAATHAYSTTAFPMLSGTLVTIAGFLPIGFARSSAGEYTFSLFFVVAIALVASWIAAVLFAPLLGVAILPAALRRRAEGELGRPMRCFRCVLVGCMRARYLVIAVALAALVASLFGARHLQRQFFPFSDRPELVVDLTLPQNANIHATDKAAARLEKLLAGNPNIDRYSFYIGQGAVRFYRPLEIRLPNDFFAQAVIVAKGLRQREALRSQLETALPTVFPDVVTRVYPLELGPPVGWPLQYRISGPDRRKVRKFAYRLADIVALNPHARTVNFDWNEPMKVIRLKVDQDKARLLHVSSADVARAIHAMTAGLTVTQVRDGIYLIDVVARADADERSAPAALRTLQIALDDGRTVPLRELATFTYGVEQPLVWRRARLPTITVQADVSSGTEPRTVTAALAPRIAAFARTLPRGYGVATGGTEEASAKGLRSVLAVVPYMALVMLTILMVQLQSFSRLALVLSVAPLGFIGVVAALLPTHTPMGFIAILGIIALSGMIVRNSLILIDRIATNIADGQAAWNAVVDATVNRCRPILLTAAASILGMVPIAGDVFWGPMAYAIIGGLTIATLLTLFFLPALYVAWFRIPAPASRRATVPSGKAAAM